MSRKGGQNKRKDGGALPDPHVGAVKSSFAKKDNLEIFSVKEHVIQAVGASDSTQNGDGSTGTISVGTSGNTDSISVRLVESPGSILEPINVVASTEWLKTNLDSVVGIELHSTEDELDGHVPSKSRDINDFFVDADCGVSRLNDPASAVPDVSQTAERVCAVPVSGENGSAAVNLDKISETQILSKTLEMILPLNKSLNTNYITCENTPVTDSKMTRRIDVNNVPKQVISFESSKDFGLIEFPDLSQSNKSTTLLTPQELENIPDECLDLEEDMENSVEDIVEKMWPNSSSMPRLPVTSGVSLLNEVDVNKICTNVELLPTRTSEISTTDSVTMNPSLATSDAMVIPSLVTTDTVAIPSLASTDSLTIPSHVALDSVSIPSIVTSCAAAVPSLVMSDSVAIPSIVNSVAPISSVPVLSYNSTPTVVLPGPVISVTQVATKTTTERVINTTSATLPTNCTLATIYISTDKGANSTQIRVNAGGSQQLYQLNTASLTGAPPMATVVQNVLPTSPVIQQTGEVTAQTTDSLTGYLLLPVGQSDTNGILMSVPLGNVSQAEEQTLEPSEISHGQGYDPTKKIWQCLEEGCGKAFKKQSKLRIHQMRHTGERPFKCTLAGCCWAFTTAYKLRRHEESHEGRKDYICEIDGCQRKFTTVYNLNSHARLHKRPCNEVCPEPDCGERFHTKRRLDLHMKNHAGAEKNYKCPVPGCDKVFFSPNCMGSHARVHQQEREDLTCKFEGCGKTFEKHCRLKQHMRTHTGEKPYICSFENCGWAFTTASKLTRHMNKHTGERNFECPIEGCNKAFMRAEHLKGHVVTHSGVRPFLCPVEGCNSRFTAKSSLYVHLKKHDHSGEKIVYFCPMEGCEKKYATKSCLRNHITKHYSTPVSASDHAHFDLVPLLAGDELTEASLDTFPAPQGDPNVTPVTAVNINTSISASLLGTADPVLISPSDYITTVAGVDQPVITTASFPTDTLTHQLSSNMVTQYIVASDLQSSGVFSGALLGVAPGNLTVPSSPVEVCATCVSPVLACTCTHSLENSTLTNSKHKSKISIGKGITQRVLQENTSGSARTDYRGNHLLSDRAKKRRLIKDKVDLPSLPVPTGLIVNGNQLINLSDDGIPTSTKTFRSTEVINSQGITYRDPDTGTTYVQTQLLQDDPPNPELYPDDTSLTSELVTLHDSPSTDHSSEYTGTTINLQDLE